MKHPLLFMLLFTAAAFAATPGFDTLVGFDTAWTLVYDGGKDKGGRVAKDELSDLKILKDGSTICVGYSSDSTSLFTQILLQKIDTLGKIVFKKLYLRDDHQYANSVALASNGDFLIGGGCFGGPVIMRTDSAGNQKWSTWYYDSLNKELRFRESATVNSIRETSHGTIICAAGDFYPDNLGLDLNNFAAYLELDSLGRVIYKGDWFMPDEFKIGGFSIDESEAGRYLMAGNQAVLYFSSSVVVWNQTYTYMLDGVGQNIANVMRVKVLRDNRAMVLGQMYEGNCWTNYKKLYYDVWWSTLDYADGSYRTRDTAGLQRGDDIAYDFAQLANGNIVFIGKKYDTGSQGGIWTFVTDSTGRRMLWEKQMRIKYKTNEGRSVVPISVCATPDSGFTIAGRYNCIADEGGTNGFVAHYIPKNPLIVATNRTLPRTLPAISATITKSRLLFRTSHPSDRLQIAIYTANGRMVANTSQGSIQQRGGAFEWDFSHAGRGVYFYTITIENSVATGSVAIGIR